MYDLKTNAIGGKNKETAEMRPKILSWALSITALVLLAGSVTAQNSYLEHGRISFDTGGLLVKGPQETEWAAAAVNALVVPGDTLWVDEEGSAEVELAGANFLRLADRSKAEVVALPPDVFIRGWIGSFYIQRLTRSEGTYVFATPAGTVEIASDSMVRLDINEQGALTVSVRWGRAVVNSDQGGEVTAMEGTRVWMDPGYLPSDATPFNKAEADAFDTWSNDRARLLAQGAQTTPKEVVVQNSTVGVYDLPRYGEWVYIDHQPYWRPTVVVNYVPYRYGYWNYMPAYGHVWIDEYPFAYVTSHYGRWRHTTSYGWVWSYDPVWSPAWVASMRVGEYYMWSPVDYYHRPVMVVGGGTFGLAGLTFSWFGCSYSHSNYLYAGPGYILRPERGWIDTIRALPPRDVYAWNVARHAHHRPLVPFDSRRIAGARDYNPPRSIRGIPGELGRSFSPMDRARRLEGALGRNTFAAARPEMKNPVRTAALGAQRAANTRPVHLNRTEQMYLRATGADRAPSGPRTASLVPESQRLGRTPGLSGPAAPGPGPSIRSGAAPVTGPASPRTNIAVRDMESSAPAPPGSGQFQRTPMRQEGGIRTAPSPSVRQPSTSAPSVRSTPQPSMQPRSISTPGVRTAPSPSVRQPAASTPSLRSTPQPSTQPRSISAPGVRTAPSPSVRQPAASTPSLRSTPQPSTQPRSISTPSVRTAPSPNLQQSPRSTSGLSSRAPNISMPSPRSSSGLSSRAPSMSMPSPRSTSGLSSRAPSISMPSPRSTSGLSSRAPSMSMPSPRSSSGLSSRAPSMSMPSPRGGSGMSVRGGGMPPMGGRRGR